MPVTLLKTWVCVFIAVRLFLDGAEEFFILPTAWYYIKSLGETKTFLGMVLSSYSMSAVLTGPLIGKFADRYGHIKLIIVFCYFLRFSGDFIYSIPFSAWFPLLGRIVSGFADGSAAVFYGQLVLHTPEQYRAKAFMFLDGLYALGAAFGPTVSSFITFDADILGWKIDAGNSPGVILATIWFISFVISLWLPSEFGHEETPAEKTVVAYEGGQTEDYPSDPPRSLGSPSTILCLFYVIFLSLFFSSTVAFCTPLLAQEHFHLPFIHVKLLFLTSSMFSFALILLLFIAAEHFEERKILVFLMSLQLIPISILAYFASCWSNISPDESYLLIFYMCFGMQYFSYAFGSSIVSQITDSKDAVFYQGSCYATLHLAYVTSRIISGFIFSQSALLYFCVGLAVFWGLGAVWFFIEYPNLAGLEFKT